MKIEIELTPDEARKIVGKALLAAFGTAIEGLAVEEIDWTKYSTRVRVVLAPPETVEAAPHD